jgi:predicted transcriptional regulator
MDPNSPVVALLSIKPHYANAILDGRKKVEFRKRRFGKAVSHVIIYATAPIMQIVGWFKVGPLHELSPDRLWRRFSSVGGISRDDFSAYYSGVSSGVAIAVAGAHRLREPLALARISSSPPPQSYSYLPASVLSLIERGDTRQPAKRLLAKRKASKGPLQKTLRRKPRSRS